MIIDEVWDKGLPEWVPHIVLPDHPVGGEIDEIDEIDYADKELVS